jgi:hypothetical protein
LGVFLENLKERVKIGDTITKPIVFIVKVETFYMILGFKLFLLLWVQVRVRERKREREREREREQER